MVSGETSTVDHADAEMQEVLNEFAALNAKPVETLDVATARAHPTPAGAMVVSVDYRRSPEAKLPAA